MHFDAVRGDLSCLHACNPLASCAACLAGENDDTDLMAVDTTAPPSGDGFWYLLRVDEGSWNSTGAAQCMDFDAVLPLGCP
jgi:hypothetical protein